MRFVAVYAPNGVHGPDWTPASEGADFALPFILEPLEPLRRELCVLSGLAHEKANANGDGPGDHARACATFLTGAQAFKTSGANLCVGVSADQVIAQTIGGATRLPSLELGGEKGRAAGECDSGYACAYSHHLAWRTPRSPLPHETDPRRVFERLFADPDAGLDAAERARRRAARTSVLDLVREDSRSLGRTLGSADRHKLEDYEAAVRALEQRLARGTDATPGARALGETTPENDTERLRLLLDLAAMALATDATRVVTVLLANEGSNRSYPELDIHDGHHTISHHGGDAAKQDQIRRINRYHAELYAHLLARLAAAEEEGSNVLANSFVLFGSGIGDGNRHNHDELPILLAGRGAGTLEPGRHVRFGSGTSVSSLYLALFERFGIQSSGFGDAREALAL
jgi:hypothetical protein